MKSTLRYGCVFLALMLLTLVASGCIDTSDPVQKAVSAIDRAIWMVQNESGDWREILRETQSKLTSDAQSMMLNEVNTAFTRAIATTGVEFRCNAGFVKTRLIQDLTSVKAKLLKQRVPDKEPQFCLTNVAEVDVSLIPQRLKWIEFFGYDFDTPGIKVFQQNGDQYVDITNACLGKPHPYLMTVDLITQGCQLTQSSRRIILRWNNKDVSTVFLSRSPNPPTITPVADQRFGPVGGGGGAEFADVVPRGARITSLQIRSGDRVDSIDTFLSTGGHFRHGGDGGTLHQIHFDEGEYITAVVGRYGTRIDQIAIRTNKKNYGPYGGGGGWNTFSFEAPAGFHIVGFIGRSQKEVDAIGVIIRQRQ